MGLTSFYIQADSFSEQIPSGILDAAEKEKEYGEVKFLSISQIGLSMKF